MKIAIDVSQIVYGTGVSVYTQELVKALLKIDPENHYLLFAGTLRQKEYVNRFYATLTGNFEGKVFIFPPTLAGLLWNRLHIWPVEKLIGEVDVFHSSDWTQPPSKAFNVTTIHDLAPLRFPKLTHPRIYDTHKARLSWVSREVDRVIVPSKATADELIEYGFDEAKIRLIPEAASPIYFTRSEEEINSVKTKYRIRGRYIMTVGVGQRKNTDRLIKAFDLARAGADIKLVLIGRGGEKLNSGRNIHVLGYVDNADLPAFYSGAEALVYPSLYEGFGIPILQAFSCGCPVVTSNLSSMAEVAGGAAVLIDPYEVESIAEGIQKALRGKIGLARKGRKQAEKFSWGKTAESTLKVYQEAKR